MSTPTIETRLHELFELERKVRKLHEQLAEQEVEALLDALTKAIAEARAIDDVDEQGLRLMRVAGLLGELEGARTVDLLIDVLDCDAPEGRNAAGSELEALAYDRFKEVALGVERALARLPEGSIALSELPYLLVEVPEPGVSKLLVKFLEHADATAVLAGLEAAIELGDPTLLKHIEKLKGDPRSVELTDDDDEGAVATLGELAEEAAEALSGALETGDDEPPARGKGA